MFCETSTAEGRQNIQLLSRGLCQLVLYAKKVKEKEKKRTSYENTLNVLLIFQKTPLNLNSVPNVIHKTFVVFSCRKVACFRDGARDFFVIRYLNKIVVYGKRLTSRISFVIQSKS